jgi:hypothetical protein
LYASPRLWVPIAYSKTAVRRNPVKRDAIVPSAITPLERTRLGSLPVRVALLVVAGLVLATGARVVSCATAAPSRFGVVID